VLGSPEDGADSGTRKPADELPSAHPPQNIIVAEGDVFDAAAEKCRAYIANDGFDFG
jgi:hypothetical protein